MLSDLRLRVGYSSSEDDLLEDFYRPVLSESIQYSRSAGYFSSAVLALAPVAFADFFGRGGRMRLICSPELTPRDIAAIAASRDPDAEASDVLLKELQAIRGRGDSGDLLTRLLASLLHEGLLQLRICIPQNHSTGPIFHDKVGILTDGQSTVAFNGSVNESAAAWAGWGNHESLEISCSWASGNDRIRIARHERIFERLWNNGVRGWRTIPHKELDAKLLSEFSRETVDEVLELIHTSAPELRGVSPAKSPRRPLLGYQNEVLENWSRSGNRGIVCFATGGGKTLVGINATKSHTATGSPTLILVPSSLLLEQWQKEISEEFPELASSIFLIGGSTNWRSRKGLLESALQKQTNGQGWIILSTYQSAGIDEFLKIVAKADNLLVVADEVHRAGMEAFQGFLKGISASQRLGLSATPERFGDPEGTLRIFDFFGNRLRPEFTIRDGITAGRLVNYVYNYSLVTLTEEEQDSWDDLSKQIARLTAIKESSGGGESERLKQMLLKRARILKKASGKVATATEVLNANVKPGQRWLVYCEDREQMSQVADALREISLPLPVMEYHSAMNGSDRSAALTYFTLEPSVLVAINCLDEGVDIPATDHALILASSSNPREYVQRRGRVLRTSPKTNKTLAWLMDTLVIDGEGKLLSSSEGERALTFAADSMNFGVNAKLATLLGTKTQTTDILFEADEGEDADG